ncbi:glycosyltransferase family 1 protein, partial [Chloroflexota bacterium]
MEHKYDRRICILSSVHPALDIRVFHKQAKSLAEAGYDVTLIAQHRKNEEIDGVKIVALPKPKNRFERIFLTTFKVFAKGLRKRSDVYHFHDPELI